MKLIPAIDILDGKCVRLTKGDYTTQKVYNTNPVEVAKEFEANGIRFLHLVDLDGAKSKHIVNYKVLEAIARETSLHIDFGGGIKSNEDVKIAFESGANQLTGGSIAVQEPALFLSWLEQYGSERILLGADANQRMIATHGWLATSGIDVVDFIRSFEQKGIQSVVCTDISKDGMLQGPSLDLYKEIMQETGVQLIASGGVSNIDDLQQLKELGCAGAIIGKAIYEGRITLNELSKLC
jgi:phosphoribosylformimino-5-aminoimidazole carboxamide ribotide isomerase